MSASILASASLLANHLLQWFRSHRSALVATVLAFSLFSWGAVGASIWLARGLLADLPDRTALRQVGSMAQATTLIDVKGRHAFTIFREQRIEVPLSRVSPHFIAAVVAVEDQRFYDHGGIDVVRVAGATLNNLLEGRAAQGGSTLTQQLARQSFLTSEKTLSRKFKEVVLAARLEREFSKAEILELYLNKVYFGDGFYGVEAASLGFLGKHAADLNVADAALLAGLLQSPSTYAPTVSRERAIARRNVVLRAMLDARAIDRPTYEASLRSELRITDVLRREEAYGRYFKEEVRKQLVERFGWDRVYQGGLKVYTTLDLDMQRAAEAEVARSLAEIEQRRLRGRDSRSGREPLQAALVALEPQTGEVRALVGGRSFDESLFNRATQAKRQPGSAFKPFVYAAALERGYTPATLIEGLRDPIMTAQGAWLPEESHSTGEAMTMRAALRTSSNRAAVQMLEEVGIPTTVQYAERLGVGSVPSVPSLALGSGEVTLLSMTSAFGAFANRGMRAEPSLIRRVETADGELLFSTAPTSTRAVSEATAFLMTTMLADVIDMGTAWPARRVGFTLPAAGKTGTTNDYRDAWFVGYTPRLVAGVWIGYDRPRTIVAGGYAAELAVPLWGRFMSAATRGDRAEWFDAPGTVTAVAICRVSGRLATDACRGAQPPTDGGGAPRSTVYTEYFARGTEPVDVCPIHTAGTIPHSVVAVNEWPATVSSPPLPARVGDRSASAQADVEPVDRSTDTTVDQAPPKKRGFWARVLRLGRGGDKARDTKK